MPKQKSSPTKVRTQAMREKIPARVADAARRILAPLAQLFVAHGLKFGDAEKLLKQAFYEAGLRELARADIESNVSRLSVSTGLHRKDVKSFTDACHEVAAARPGVDDIASIDSGSYASRLYTRWTTDPACLTGTRVRDLPLRAEAEEPSFESLAREVSNDAHPRALLEELKRLGLVEIIDEGNTVRLKPGGFVPLFERTEMLALLGDNLADHLETAVGNVLADSDKRLEQAVFMEGLSARSVTRVEAQSRQLWSSNMQSLVRSITRLAQVDAKSSIDERYRLRIGMYFYTDRPRATETDAPITDIAQSNPTSKTSSRS